MSKKQNMVSNPPFQAALAALKREFRKWYGTISVEELAVNRQLAAEIATLEKMFTKQGV